MPPSFTVELETPTLEYCQKRLQEAGYSPSLEWKETTEHFSDEGLNSVRVRGSFVVRDIRFAFTWSSQNPGGIEVPIADFTTEEQNILLDAMDAVFPESKPSPSSIQNTTAVDEWKAKGGCVLVLLAVVAVIAFAIYGFVVFIRKL
jgi:hypothetical protein